MCLYYFWATYLGNVRYWSTQFRKVLSSFLSNLKKAVRRWDPMHFYHHFLLDIMPSCQVTWHLTRRHLRLVDLLKSSYSIWGFYAFFSSITISKWNIETFISNWRSDLFWRMSCLCIWNRIFLIYFPMFCTKAVNSFSPNVSYWTILMLYFWRILSRWKIRFLLDFLHSWTTWEVCTSFSEENSKQSLFRAKIT